MNIFFKNKEIEGEVIMFFENILWSLFPIFVILSISNVPTIFAAAYSTLFAAIFFAIMLTIKRQWHELRIKDAWKDILITTFLIGVLFYLFFFLGLQTTTAGNTSIIALMEVFFTMMILGFWKKEKQTYKSVGGGTLMVIGAALILFNDITSINIGDIYILLATAIAPIGNYFSQRARKIVGSNSIMFIRSILSGLFLLALAYIIETPPAFEQIYSSLFSLFITGFILLGLAKILWIEAIHRLTITKSISLAAYSPAFTLLFAYFILGESPYLFQILGFIPMVIGTYLISEIKNFAKQK